MFYITKEKVQSKIRSDESIDALDIYVTKEEKIEFMHKAHTEGRLKNILKKLYPTDKTYNYNWNSSYSIENKNVLGLCVEYAITIIENPNIICTGRAVNLSYEKLCSNFDNVNYVKKLDYNGNYCRLISTNQLQTGWSFRRILLDRVNTEFIPEEPEWVFDEKSRFSKYIVYKPGIEIYNIPTFVYDKDIDKFVNAGFIAKQALIYIIIESEEHLNKMRLIKDKFNSVFIIKIDRISPKSYTKIKNLFWGKLKIFVSSDGDLFDFQRFKNVFSEDFNFFIESSLNDSINFEQTNRVIDFRTFGLIKQDGMYKMLDKSVEPSDFSFYNLRKELNLPGEKVKIYTDSTDYSL